MKKYIKGFLGAALVLAIFAMTINSNSLESFAPQNGDYTYTVSKSEATITKYNGAGGTVIIPSSLDGYPVTAIGSFAFYKCSGLISLEIPNTVKTIGESAFGICMNLTSIKLPEYKATIADNAFSVQ